MGPGIALERREGLLELAAAHVVERLRDLHLRRELEVRLGAQGLDDPLEAGHDVGVDDGRDELGRNGHVLLGELLPLAQRLLEAVLLEHVVDVRLQVVVLHARLAHLVTGRGRGRGWGGGRGGFKSRG